MKRRTKLVAAAAAAFPNLTGEKSMRHPPFNSLAGAVVRCSTPVMTRVTLTRRWRGVLTCLLGAMAALCLAAAPARAAGTVTFPMYVSSGDGSIVQVDSAGGVSPFATLPAGSYPKGVAFDGNGNLFVSEAGNNRISKITPGGAVSPFATLPFQPIGLAFDGSGNLYTGGGVFLAAGEIDKITPSGVVTTFATQSRGAPRGLAFDGAGNLYAAVASGVPTEDQPERIEKFTPGGAASTFATFASGTSPNGLAFDDSGNLYVSPFGEDWIRKITPGGVVSLFAALPTNSGPEGLAFDDSGNLYVANYSIGQISKISPDGLTVTPFVTGIASPSFIAFTSVPEPTSLGLLIPLVAGALLRRRRGR